MLVCFFFQAEDGIRDLVRSRGLGDVYKRQHVLSATHPAILHFCQSNQRAQTFQIPRGAGKVGYCLLYTSDAADDLLCVDLGGRRILKKKNTHITNYSTP